MHKIITSNLILLLLILSSFVSVKELKAESSAWVPQEVLLKPSNKLLAKGSMILNSQGLVDQNSLANELAQKFSNLSFEVNPIKDFESTQAISHNTQLLAAHSEARLDRWYKVTYKAASNYQKTVEDPRTLCNAIKSDYTCQPNFIVRTSAQQCYQAKNGYTNDQFSAALWGLERVKAQNAWPRGQGKNVLIAVVDTGIDYNHPDLSNNIFRNFREIKGQPGVDDDSNGIVDDFYGANFVNSVPNNYPLDDHFHGTHIAGTIAAVADNQIGIAGISPQATIMAVKVIDSTGQGTVENIAKGIRYSLLTYLGNRRAMGLKGLVINYSLRCICRSNPIVEEQVKLLYEYGGVLVAAAGNDNNNAAKYSPQNMPISVTVGAIAPNLMRASFSNYGNVVDVSAPGVGIASSVPANNYACFDGTSMAAPHVSGVVALVMGSNPLLTANQIENILVSTASPYPSSQGVSFGAGIVNANQASIMTAGQLDFGQDLPLILGSDAGDAPIVKISPASKISCSKRILLAFDSSNISGVRVATGDINGDGTPDLITAPGTDSGPRIKVFDGKDCTQMLANFYAYDKAFRGGVFVASGDFDADGFDDIITGAGAGGGPHVRIFSGRNNGVLYEVFAYAAEFGGGVQVAAGDINNDGYSDVITGAGPGGGPHIRVISGKDRTISLGFFAYDANFGGGAYVAAGDVNGDGFSDIITGAGSGGGPHVRVFSGKDHNTLLADFFAYDAAFSGGVRVGAGDLNGDGLSDLITVPGPGGGAQVQVYDRANPAKLIANFFAEPPWLRRGHFVASGR